VYKATMRNPHGYMVIDGEENDTITCNHCNAIVVVTKDKPGGFCTKCSGLICDACVDKNDCRPFEKWLEKVEANQRRENFLKSVGI
jgi:hypothetical protein